jgi:hypothetical protein
MIHSGLYTRLVLLGNGDDARRCRDVHTEGQTIEESESFARMLAAQDSTRNQVPLIPASRRHNYANDPPSGSPPFFASTLQVRPTTTVQRSCSPSPLRLCETSSNQIFPLERLHLSPLAGLAFVLYSCAFPAIRPGPVWCLSHAISVSKLDAGQGGSGLGTCWPLPAEPPLCWVAAQDSETHSVPCVDVFPSPHSLVTATALATRSKEEERVRSPSEIGYMKVLARLRNLH